MQTALSVKVCPADRAVPMANVCATDGHGVPGLRIGVGTSVMAAGRLAET